MRLCKKNILLFFSFIFFFFPLGIVFGSTQASWPSPSPLTGITLSKSTEFHEFIAYLYGWGIGIGGLLVFAVLIFAGIEYMTSIGNSSQMQRATGRMTSAAVGLVLLLSSWLILNTINPQITRVEPLPSLWDTQLLEDTLSLDIEDAKEPPCEFVLFYTETNFRGSETEKSPGTYEDFRFQSMKTFRKMTQEEQERYDSSKEDSLEGSEVQAGKYIEGGSCLVTVYEGERSGLLNLGWSPCGTAIGSAQATTQNLGPFIRGEEEDIACYMVENVGKNSSSSGSSVMPGLNENLDME